MYGKRYFKNERKRGRDAVKQDCTVSIVSLGCAKNVVDAEIMIGLLREAGYAISEDQAAADIIIVNTCAFIESAKTEAIDALLDAASYKKDRCKAVIAAGCLAQRYAAQIKAELPEVDAIVGINGYGSILEAVKACQKQEFYEYCNYTGDVTYLDYPRVLSTPAGSAYLKISEGCDNRCAYCAIPDIRGPFRSRKMEDIVQEAKRLASCGIKEIVLVAQDTSRYGKDIFGQPKLAELLYALNEINGIEWIRILYLYPDEIAAELVEAMKNCEKVLHYIDLPLQHINADVLRQMNRRGTPADIKAVIHKFRKELPDCVIRTSLIVGFPGETEAQFNELKAFVQETRFDRLGVFPYSSEEGTPAYRMKNKVKDAVKQQRLDEIMALQQKISYENNAARIGKIYDVIVEGVSSDGIFYYGRSYAEGPDVDGRIYFTAEAPLNAGDIVKIEVLIAEEYDLTGRQICV